MGKDFRDQRCVIPFGFAAARSNRLRQLPDPFERGKNGCNCSGIRDAAPRTQCIEQFFRGVGDCGNA
ncbi:MAG: hypothetical protein K2X31_11265, partial [Sphingopyxis sp.]|nr:hypothetical protein [Sphingopyxis sp.]